MFYLRILNFHSGHAPGSEISVTFSHVESRARITRSFYRSRKYRHQINRFRRILRDQRNNRLKSSDLFPGSRKQPFSGGEY